jgi:hypothetical protein
MEQLATIRLENFNSISFLLHIFRLFFVGLYAPHNYHRIPRLEKQVNVKNGQVRECNLMYVSADKLVDDRTLPE